MVPVESSQMNPECDNIFFFSAQKSNLNFGPVGIQSVDLETI